MVIDRSGVSDGLGQRGKRDAKTLLRFWRLDDLWLYWEWVIWRSFAIQLDGSMGGPAGNSSLENGKGAL